MDKPTVGRAVHYVDDTVEGTPCRAATITEAPDAGGADAAIESVALGIMRPDGLSFQAEVPADHSGSKTPGSWHWPERV